MERGAAMSKRAGARSADAKKGRSAERSLPLAPPHVLLKQVQHIIYTTGFFFEFNNNDNNNNNI